MMERLSIMMISEKDERREIESKKKKNKYEYKHCSIKLELFDQTEYQKFHFN